MKSGDRIATGTGASRRRLTEEEAMAGGLPDLMTREEWQAMHNRSLIAEGDANERTFDARIAAEIGMDNTPRRVEVRPATAADHIAALEALGAKKVPRVVTIEDTKWKTVYSARGGRTVLVLTEEMDA
jgi:hypothetical protein